MTPSPLRVYSFVPWDRGAKVRWLLTEMAVAFESRLLDRKTKENETPEYLRLNPMGRVPTLEIEGRVMFESGAICMFLADRFAERGMAPAPQAPERDKYLQWMFFASATLDVAQTRIMVIEDIPAGEVQSTKQSILQSDLRDAMTALDQALGAGPFLVGSRFSAADICVSYHLYWCTLWPELNGIIQDFPRVTQYLERMKAMPSAVQADVFSYKE